MQNSIHKRTVEEADYMLQTGKTVREIAGIFKVSKSTVHKDLNERLIEIDANLYNEVSNILKYHLDIRHIRGGNATKEKFLNKKLEF